MSLHKRLLALEKKGHRDAGTLIMPGGGTRAFRVSDPLGLTLAAMRRRYAQLCGHPHPESGFDSALGLLERSTGIHPDSPPLISVAHSVLHD